MPDKASQALACEAAGDLSGALDAWQAALAADPNSVEIVARLADLAFRLTFFDMAAGQGVYPKTLDYKSAYTLQFVTPPAK